MSIEITGLDKLQRDLEELQRALKSLDGEIVKLDVNPADPASVQKAIQQMEKAVDGKVSAYGNNAIVLNITKEAKSLYRDQILKLANDKR